MEKETDGAENKDSGVEMYIPYSSDGYLTLSPSLPHRVQKTRQALNHPTTPASRIERWNTQDHYRTALEALLQHHWSVFPITEQKLPPAIGMSYSDGMPKRLSWKKYQAQRPSRDEVLFWEKTYEPAAWVVVTGFLSGIVVLDFDGDMGKQTLAMLRLEPHLQTGSGGYHVYFKHPGWRVRTLNSKSKKALGRRYPGLDIRADGGYAAFCGRNTSGPYRWLREPVPDELELLPPELRRALGLLQPPKKRVPLPPSITPQRPSGKPGPLKPGTEISQQTLPTISMHVLLEQALQKVYKDGEGRNDAGFWLACRLHNTFVSEAEAHEIMLEYANRVPTVNTKGQPELYSRSEALASLRSAYRG